MRRSQAAAGLALVVGIALGLPSSAGAAPAPPAGAGGCTAKTVACYPSCRWEWTGQAAPLGQTADTGPCPWVPDVTTMLDNWQGNATTAVDVTNWPASVVADRGTGWPDSGTAPAADVRVVNDSGAGAVPVKLWDDAFTIGAVLLAGVFAGWGLLGRLWPGAPKVVG